MAVADWDVSKNCIQIEYRRHKTHLRFVGVGKRGFSLNSIENVSSFY